MLTLTGVLLAVSVFCVVVIGPDGRYAIGGLSGGAFFAIAWFGVLAFGGLAVDLVARDFCLVARLGDMLVVYLPFGLHRLLRGYRYSFLEQPDLHVSLTENGSTSRVRISVLAGHRPLRSFVVPAMQLDDATRSKCTVNPAPSTSE